jgi:hypothetical protein
MRYSAEKSKSQHIAAPQSFFHSAMQSDLPDGRGSRIPVQ